MDLETINIINNRVLNSRGKAYLISGLITGVIVFGMSFTFLHILSPSYVKNKKNKINYTILTFYSLLITIFYASIYIFILGQK